MMCFLAECYFIRVVYKSASVQKRDHLSSQFGVRLNTYISIDTILCSIYDHYRHKF